MRSAGTGQEGPEAAADSAPAGAASSNKPGSTCFCSALGGGGGFAGGGFAGGGLAGGAAGFAAGAPLPRFITGGAMRAGACGGRVCAIGVCGLTGLRSANPGGGPAAGAGEAAAGFAGVGAGAGGAAARPPFLSQSRMLASSSGARPAKRICTEGPPRTTNPQLWKLPQLSRTVSPLFTGSSPGASMPAALIAAYSIRAVEVRVEIETGAGVPASGDQLKPTAATSRARNWSLGMGMKSRSLAPARKHSSRCAVCSRCRTATTLPPRSRTLGASACSAAGSGLSGAP
ncbi:MAG: hypothetical protein E6J78_17500 [Deltaproteobacteria bacterium]|nr:MAG: hypothetical protein E6J78_17500 [Deltaproteobacteria bacterium]